MTRNKGNVYDAYAICFHREIVACIVIEGVGS